MGPVSKENEATDKGLLSNGLSRQVKIAKRKEDQENYEEENVFEDGELLHKLLAITMKESLYKAADPKSQKVINFLQPHKLQDVLSLDVTDKGSQNILEIEEIIETIVKYSVRTSHPHFHNQLFGGVDEVALMSAWLLEALNTNQYTFEVAPVFVMFENYLIKMLSQLFGWSDGDGIFSPGGSTSNMYAIACARHHKFPNLKKTGFFGQKELVIFTSEMCHYSIMKAANWMGLGTNQVVKVATDDNGKMIVASLQEAVNAVRAEGREPFFVNATAGTTVFGAYDPLQEIAEVCEAEGLWMHADACWGGGVIVSENHRGLLKGINRADSIAWNPHKMLCAPLQCSTFLVKRKGLLSDCNKVGASYLFQQDKCYDVSYDMGDKSVQCGRKADSLKIWIMFKIHGLKKLGDRVDAAFKAARDLEDQIKRRDGFRLVVNEGACTNVCFWYIPPSLRNCAEDDDYWVKIGKVAPIIKGRMAKAGTLLVGYQPMECKKLVNFFRMITTGYPISTSQDMCYVLDEIERNGRDI